ncbi:MAG TPA: hypothetical protein VMF88_03680 [Bacteroidota bacterium]|nr:hypothetical protein [Bacteroidota bacterium]
MTISRVSLLVLFVVQEGVFGGNSAAQTSGNSFRQNSADSLCIPEYSTEDSSLISFQYFLPPVLRDEGTLKRYIRDPRFQQLRRSCSDTLAVDAIFARAFEIADGTMSHALLVATLATFDHFRLGLKIPLVGPLYLPLTVVESRKEFSDRYMHLPRRVLPDSAGRLRRDRDKLQHFFGSAYLTYVFNSRTIANFFGDFVEWGEPLFVVGGDYDDRDKYANHLGQEFGMRLLDGEEVMPSDVLWKK